MIKKTLEDILEKANRVHNNFYSYDKITEYKGCDCKYIITCPIHGDFTQTFYYHINKKQGCPLCGIERAKKKRALDIDEVKRRITECGYEITDDFKYVNNNTPIEIICKKHGNFKIRPNLLFKGDRCKKCSIEKRSSNNFLTNDEFIKRITELYGDKLDLSKTFYKGSDKKICVICRKHGEYYTTPNCLYKGISCNMCRNEKIASLKLKTQEEFLNESKKLYGDNFLMDKAIYTGEDNKIIIGCKKHGYFEQTPRCHLRGNGCPICNTKVSSLENKIKRFLSEKGIKFLQQKQVPNSLLKLDFYLPEYNCAIECQGGQHFKMVDYFGGNEGFTKTKERDNRKKKLCEEIGIKLFYYSNVNYDNFLGEKVYHDPNEMINEIFSYNNKS